MSAGEHCVGGQRGVRLVNEAGVMRSLGQLISVEFGAPGRYTGAASGDVITMSLKREGWLEPKTEAVT